MHTCSRCITRSPRAGPVTAAWVTTVTGPHERLSKAAALDPGEQMAVCSLTTGRWDERSGTWAAHPLAVHCSPSALIWVCHPLCGQGSPGPCPQLITPLYPPISSCSSVTFLPESRGQVQLPCCLHLVAWTHTHSFIL